MLCVAITGPLKDIEQQIGSTLFDADLIELRLDIIEGWDVQWLKKLRKEFPLPMIFVLRSRAQGGSYNKSEKKRLEELRKLADLKPEYLDLESDIDPKFVEEIRSRHPEISIILSHHNFTEIPTDLDALYENMRKTPATIYKIAVTPSNTTETMRFVCWAKGKNIIAICMGSEGEMSRIVAPLIGSPLSYACLNTELGSAPGQIPFNIMTDRYNYQSLNANTALYGLIGDPVTQSISAETHNRFFAKNHLQALYVKMCVEASKLKEFLEAAKEFPLRGLSVTMPLKEVIIPYLDGIDPQAQEIGAVNTLLLKDSRWVGYNTDGIGALNAVEQVVPVKGKKIVLLGAGGSAKAIAYEACQRGALVTIVNRHKERAEELAHQYGGQALGLDEMGACAKTGYDILINSTPIEMPISEEDIIAGSLVMDIKVNPNGSPLLELATTKGCSTLSFYEMFVEQALRQFSLWFGKNFTIDDFPEKLLP